ncbi:MAG: hypothetical protein FJ358_04675 [Thaumarchaeota archaeon]|nr:hypothetical protein [Nitrososphaerota archaeon]
MRKKAPKLEDVLAEELRREMFLDAGSKFRYVDDWDTIMDSIYELPVQMDGYDKKVADMKLIQEMISVLSAADFDDVKRSESRRKQLKQFKNTMQMYYNLIFAKGDAKTGYGAMIYFPNIKSDNPERSSGIVLMAKHYSKDKTNKITYEKARFDDFLIEVKPYIEILGDLYRKIRKF